MNAFLYASAQETTAQTDEELIAAPGTGRKIVVLSVYLSSDTEQTVTLLDESADLWEQYVAARGGQVADSGSVPLFEAAENESLSLTSTEAAALFVSVTYIELDT